MSFWLPENKGIFKKLTISPFHLKIRRESRCRNPQQDIHSPGACVMDNGGLMCISLPPMVKNPQYSLPESLPALQGLASSVSAEDSLCC